MDNPGAPQKLKTPNQRTQQTLEWCKLKPHPDSLMYRSPNAPSFEDILPYSPDPTNATQFWKTLYVEDDSEPL